MGATVAIVRLPAQSGALKRSLQRASLAFAFPKGLFRASVGRDGGGALYLLVPPANKHIRCQRRVYVYKILLTTPPGFTRPAFHFFPLSTDGLLSLIRKAIGLVSSTKRSASFSISVRTADYSTLAARTLFTTSARLCGCRISGFAPVIFYVFPFRLASPAMKTGTCPFFSRPFAPLFLCPS